MNESIRRGFIAYWSGRVQADRSGIECLFCFCYCITFTAEETVFVALATINIAMQIQYNTLYSNCTQTLGKAGQECFGVGRTRQFMAG